MPAKIGRPVVASPRSKRSPSSHPRESCFPRRHGVAGLERLAWLGLGTEASRRSWTSHCRYGIWVLGCGFPTEPSPSPSNYSWLPKSCDFQVSPDSQVSPPFDSQTPSIQLPEPA